MTRRYEAVCVFRPEDEPFSKGKEVVRAELEQLGATVVKEDDMGQRTFAYPIKKLNQGHYYVFVVDMEPEQAHQTEAALKHKEDLLRFLMVRQEK